MSHMNGVEFLGQYRYKISDLNETGVRLNMLIGYARTSTAEQEAGLEAQHRDLSAAGVEKLFSEQVSSVDTTKRAQLDAALDYLRDGDCLVVTRLDRLARSVAHLLTLIERIEAKGAGLRILNMGVDTSTPTGKLMLTTLAGVAEFERAIMLERQREGIARAKAEGKYKGRKPTAQAQRNKVRALKAAGKAISTIIDETGLSRASVYRLLQGEPESIYSKNDSEHGS